MQTLHRWFAGMFVRRPGPASGLSLSSHSVTPSHAQILLEFSNMPAERAITPHASLQHYEACHYGAYGQTQLKYSLIY